MCCKYLDEATARKNQIREQNLSVAVKKFWPGQGHG